ncbi:MAG: sigma-54 dependent transcriptional regulator [Bacteroidota bacterium]
MNRAARILVVDDELVICRSCEKVFKRAGHEVVYATSGRQALDILAESAFDVVFTDLKMMDVGGMEVVATVRQRYPSTVVVVITGYATVASAVETMRSGAFDYLPKPFTAGELLGVLERALEKRRRTVMGIGDTAYDEESGFEGLIGKSPRMCEVYRLIRKVAPTDCTVLLVGESGTGKDLTARAIHMESRRRKERFVAVDVSTLSSTLLESELFGHVKGAFTGATGDKPGLFEVANHGTIFLDEIGNLLPETQAPLLRVLQEKEFMPVGSTTVRKVDVRLMFATNKNLKQLVQEGTFREDLYYRLNVFPIKLPSLRERPEDVPDLALHFLKKCCDALGRPRPAIQSEAMDALTHYDWPGNVRELEHVMERLMILVEGDRIEAVHVAAALFRAETMARSSIPSNSEELKRLKQQIREASVQELEKRFVIEALARAGGNISEAARCVSMQRSNFQALMRRHGIRRGEGPA